MASIPSRGLAWILAIIALAWVPACWRPRSNDAAAGGFAAPGWNHGAQAGAEAQAGAAFQATWDAPAGRSPVSIVGVSTDQDGQRAVSDVLTDRTEADMRGFVDGLGRPPPEPDAGLATARPRAESSDRCLHWVDGGLEPGPCDAEPDAGAPQPD